MSKESLTSAYRKKKVLITGGLGFIGSNLAIRLAEAGANVTLVDSLIPEYGGNVFNVNDIKNKIKINISDVRDEHSMNYLVRGQDYLFNLAGTLSHIDSMKDPYTDLEINCRSQLSILESCRKFNPQIKIVFTGTRGQYGRAEYLPVDEKHPQNPIDVNGINNVAGEMYHLLYYKAYGIRAVSLRLSNTYGPRHQMRHHRQGIINWFVRQAIDGQKINIYGDGKQIRDTNYVDDVVGAIFLAGSDSKADGEVFNLGGFPTNLIDLAKLIVKIAKKGGYKLIDYPAESKYIEIGDYVADYSKAAKILGWKPKIGLQIGLAGTIDFYKKNKKHYW